MAGYPIPKPSGEFEIRYGITILRGNESTGYLSSTHYIDPAARDLALRLDVAPRSAWADGALESGQQVDFGRWQGWLHQDSNSFAFECGAAINRDLWCVAFFADSLPREDFARFAASVGFSDP